MGVDIYHCEDCKENLHHDYLPNCVVCEENNLCDRCVDKKNYVQHKKREFYICDKCIYDCPNDEIIKGLSNYGCELSDDEYIKEIERIKRLKKGKKEYLQERLNEIKYELKDLQSEKKRILEEINKISK